MIRYKFFIKGLVQGVGFRPFIYKKAKKLNLSGFVRNSSSVVELEIEGEKDNIKKFEKSLKILPPLARIDDIKKIEIKPLYRGQFEIIDSNNNDLKTALVPPDSAICKECLKDTANFLSKYSNYFATNCVNCGPRFSIIQTVPYDRVNTSMKKFKMCKSCQDDYQNPLNRRYHAEVIGCRECGARLELRIKSEELKITDEEKFKLVAKFIKEGKIGAIKGVGGFHIVCDSSNVKVIKKLRVSKNRPTKPFAIMCKNIAQIKTFAKVSKKEEELLKSKSAPIVILDKLNPTPNSQFSTLHSPLNKIGCFLPYTALHHLLFKHLKNPIIATSANLGGEPIISESKEIEERLPFIDFILDFDREIINKIDDSLVQVVDNKIQILRLSRGFSPKVIKLPFKIDKKILAVGANQKSAISIAFEDTIILSPHIGDLDNLNSINFFKKTLQTFERFYDFKPDIIVCDKHLGYESTKIAKKLENNGIKLVQVQHHIAHLYSVMAEHNLSNSYTSFIFDGTGLGDDKTLWGGEIFVGENRKYHFKPIKLIGGEKAIKSPRRVALSMLFDKFGFDLDKIKRFNFGFSEVELKILYQSWSKNLNSPLSSSVGRIFDAIASFENLCQIQTYEGEAGMVSEWKIKNEELKIKNGEFDYDINGGVIEINFDFFDKNLVIKFYNTLAKIIIDIAKMEGLAIILSGGVFQNKTLLEMIIKNFKKENLEFFYNQTTPINDGGISLGQIYHTVLNL